MLLGYFSAMEAFEFAVKYSLSEYQEIIRHRVGLMITRQSSEAVGKKSIWPWVGGCIVAAGITVTLFFNGFLMLSVAAALVVAVLALNPLVMTERGYKTIMPLIACAVAIVSGKLKPLYHFKIDESGIQRSSNQKTVAVRWEEVASIERYPTALMIELKRGAIPLPLRSLTADQATAVLSARAGFGIGTGQIS